MYELIKKIGRFLKPFLHRLIAFFIRRSVVDPTALAPERVRRILIIRQHNELGDLLMASPTVRAFKQYFPRAALDMVVRPKIEPIARGNKKLRRVIVFDKKKFWRRPWLYFRFFRSLYKSKYDLVVVLSSVSVSTTSALFAWLCGAPICAGRVEEDLTSSPYLKTLFNVVVPKGRTRRNQVEKNLDFLRAVVPNAVVEDLSYDYAPTKGAQRWADTFLKRKKRRKLLRYRRMVFVHPGAGKEENRWPARRFAELADRLIVRGYTVLVDWSPGDEQVVKKMLEAMRFKAVEVPVVDLAKLAALISRCQLFVGNDTGVLHLAAAAGTPTVGLYGPTDPLDWKPPGVTNVALRARGGEMVNLSVGEVVKTVTRI